MRWLHRPLAPVLSLGVLGSILALSYGHAEQAADDERQVARAVASRLDAHVKAQLDVVAELADRLARWEVMPAAALVDALRGAAARHLEIQQLVVGDRAGRVLAAWDTRQPPGRESGSAPGLDPVLQRRQVLASRRGLLVRGEGRAGHLARLSVAAAIQRPDGSRPGYVAATLDLARLRRSLLGMVPARGELRVETRQGLQVYPCVTRPDAGGHAAETSRFRVRVALPAPTVWPWRIAAMACLAGLLWLGMARSPRARSG